jgi:hypothetical protein
LKFIFALFILIFSFASYCSASEAGKGDNVVREIEFDDCKLKITDPYGGVLKKTRESTPVNAYYVVSSINNFWKKRETLIRMRCRNKDPGKAISDMGLRRDGNDWKLSSEKYIPLPEENAALYVLNGKNWNGAGSSADQTFGEEDERTRSFSFCMVGKKQTVCGSISIVAYLSRPKESTLPQVIKLLESIEFIDDDAPPSAASTASGK